MASSRRALSAVSSAWRSASASLSRCQPVLSIKIQTPTYSVKRHNSQHRVVLVPEIPNDTKETNPLLGPYSDERLPQFENMTERNCFFGMGKTLLEFESAVREFQDRCAEGVTDFDELFGPLERARCQFDSTWAIVNLLLLVKDGLDSDRFSKLHERSERASLTKFDSRIIFDHLTKIKEEHLEKGHLRPDQVRILDRHLMECKHQGYELSENKHAELHETWMKKLRNSSLDYNFRMMTSTERYRHTITDPNIVRDFPVDVLRAMGTDTSQPARGPWTVTLHPYIYRQYMSYCPDRNMRYNAHLADVTRGSSSIDPYTSVLAIVKDIRQYQLDVASTLGYKNYVEMSMETKMAGNLDNVKTMIASLLAKARERQELELENLQSYAESRGFDEDLEIYDVAYFQRKQRRTLIGMTEEELRDYLPLPKVLDGVFQLCSKLFDIQFQEVTEESSKWHPEVRLFRITDGDGKKTLGQFYLDAFIRDDKGYAGGDKGWYIPIRPRSAMGRSEPLGAMIFAFSPPGYGKPSLLSFSETQELLRNFGSLLQHILCESDYADTCGKTGLEWDAIDFVGFFMTHWLYQPDVLKLVSGHWSSGEPLKDEVIQTLCTTARHHLAGYHLCLDLYKAAFDLAFHSETGDTESYMDMADKMRKEYLLLPTIKGDTFPMYFSEVMGGDSPAAYFSTTWAKMLAADAFSAVQEAIPIENNNGNNEIQSFERDEVKAVTKRFRNTFLALGSSRPMAETFRQFRGRDPSHEALLLSLGLKSVTVPKKKAAAST